MLDGQRRKVSIGHEIRPPPHVRHEGREYFPVTLRGQGNPDGLRR